MTPGFEDIHQFPVSIICANENVKALYRSISPKLALKKVSVINSTSGCRVQVILCSDTRPMQDLLSLFGELDSQARKIIVICQKALLEESLVTRFIIAGINEIIYFRDEETLVEMICSRVKRWQKIDEMMASSEVQNKIIGESRQWKLFLQNIVEAAYFTSSSIFLAGDSGTGKELTASLVHELDQRKEKKELVVLDCTTISPDLSGSEFYGHEKGAFTNAIYSRDGAFAMAHKGTLFLDEVGELPASMQAGLLRVIQEGTFKKVGSNMWQRSDFRLISATNRNLKDEIGKGNFRSDLYFRIAASVFQLPSLRKRRSDIPELVRYFLREELEVIVAPEIDPFVMNLLMNRDYPGNIRELKQLVTRIAVRYTGDGPITIGCIPEDEFLTAGRSRATDKETDIEESVRMAIAAGKDLSQLEADVRSLALKIALESSGGNKTMAARKLNVTVRTLQNIRGNKSETKMLE